MIINTKRLVLREIHITDAEDMFEYSKNPNVGPNAGWKPHQNIEETIGIINAIFLEKDGIFGIVYNNKMIGSVGLIDDPKRENPNAKMLGYALGEEYWGQGIMTEAANAVVKFGFEEMKLDLISAYCYPFNKRSKSVIKKLGFEYEGTLKLCEKLYNGKTYDNECYYLLKNF